MLHCFLWWFMVRINIQMVSPTRPQCSNFQNTISESISQTNQITAYAMINVTSTTNELLLPVIWTNSVYFLLLGNRKLKRKSMENGVSGSVCHWLSLIDLLHSDIQLFEYRMNANECLNTYSWIQNNVPKKCRRELMRNIKWICDSFWMR